MVGRGLSGWLPGISLDENGREQAKRLVGRIESVPLSAIYSSPLERAVETAEPLARCRKLDIHQHRAFGEINFGDWQGKDFTEIGKDSRWAQFNDFRSFTPAPGGEMMLETQARFVRGLTEIVPAHAGQNVAIFSHADAIKSAVTHFLGIPIDFHLRLEISPASVTILELNGGYSIIRSVNITGNIPFN